MVYRSRIVVLHGVGVAVEPRREEIDLGTEIRPLEDGDVDRDGRLDLLTASPSAVLVLRGLGGEASARPRATESD